MVPYYGDYAVNAVVYIPINTFDSNDPAASVTVTNLLNTDVHIHKDGGTTQRNNAAGITMTIDYDTITGNHLLAIDTSDNTVADFFQAGHEYQVRVEGITVDAGTLNSWVGAFSIERANGAMARLKAVPKVDVETIKTRAITCGAAVTIRADVGHAGVPGAENGAAYVAAGGAKLAQTVDLTAGQSIAASSVPAVVLANSASHGGGASVITLLTPIAATVPDTQKVDLNTVKTKGVTCADAITVLPSVGAASAQTATLDTIKADTAAILTDTGTTLDGRIPAALAADGFMKASLFGAMGTALTETAGQIAAAFKKLFDVAVPVFTAASVNQTIDNPTAAAIGTDAASKVLVTPAQKIVTDANGKVTYSNAAPPSAADVKVAMEADGSKIDHLWETTEDDAGVRRFTANALELGPSGSGLDAAEVRAAIGLASANLDTQIAALPTDADVNAACDTAISDAVLATAANLATVDTVVDAIKAKTDSLSFTVGGKIDANAKYINDAQLQGNGTASNQWRPV